MAARRAARASALVATGARPRRSRRARTTSRPRMRCRAAASTRRPRAPTNRSPSARSAAGTRDWRCWPRANTCWRAGSTMPSACSAGAGPVARRRRRAAGAGAGGGRARAAAARQAALDALQSAPGTLAGPARRRTARLRAQAEFAAGRTARRRAHDGGARRSCSARPDERRAACGPAGGGAAREPRRRPVPASATPYERAWFELGQVLGARSPTPPRSRGAQRTGARGIPTTRARSSCRRPPRPRRRAGLAARSPPDRRRRRSRCCCRCPGRMQAAGRGGARRFPRRGTGRTARAQAADRLVDTAELGAAAAYQSALAVGAQAVAGPLMKEDLAALVAAHSAARARRWRSTRSPGTRRRRSCSSSRSTRSRRRARRRAASPRTGSSTASRCSRATPGATGCRPPSRPRRGGRPRADRDRSSTTRPPGISPGRCARRSAASAAPATATRRARRSARRRCRGPRRARSSRSSPRRRRRPGRCCPQLRFQMAYDAAGVRHVGRLGAERARRARPRRPDASRDAVDPATAGRARRSSGTSLQTGRSAAVRGRLRLYAFGFDAYQLLRGLNSPRAASRSTDSPGG